MSNINDYLKIVLTIIIVVFLHFIVHEFAHALMAKALGYEIIIGINSVSLSSGVYESRADAMLVSISGPLITLIIAIIAADISRKRQSLTAFWVVLTAAFQRLLAQSVSFANPNDEMRVSIDLGLGSWALPLLSIAILVAISVWAWRGPRPKVLLFVVAWIAMSIAFSAIVFGEQYLPKLIW